MSHVVCIGDCTWDTFIQIDSATVKYGKKSHRPEWLCLNYADKIAIEQTSESSGGNAGNVAVGLKRLGISTSLCTELGNDTPGKNILEQMKKQNIDTSLSKIHKNKKTRYSFVLTHKGERTILSHFEKRTYSFPKQFSEPQWIYYTSLGPSFENIQKHLLPYLKKHPQVRLACNPGSYQLKNGLDTFKKILPFTHLLFVNKEEAEVLTHSKGKLPDLGKKLLGLGVQTVVLTDGTLGSYATNGKEYASFGIYEAPVVSKTGAGDAFASGFLAGVLKNKPMAECILWGSANAASVTQHLGAHTGLLSPSQLKKFIASHS